MFILGGREMESGEVSIRDRIDGDLGAAPMAEAIAKLQTEINGRVVRQSFSGSAGFVAKGSQNEY
jgi:threonyl-tRNA synthetase